MYSKRFFTNLSHIREAYMSLPYCFKALKEYYSSRVQTLRQVLGDANDYLPNSRTRSAVSDYFYSLVSEKYKNTVSVSISQLKQALEAEDDSVTFTVKKIGQNISDVNLTASEVVQDIIDNFNDALANESFYESLSETAMNEKINVTNFITNIQAKIGSIQLPDKVNTFLSVLKTAGTPVEAFQSVLANPAPSSDLVFDFDDFNTSTNPFISAIIEISTSISGVVSKAFEGVKTLTGAIAAAGKAVGDLVIWVLKKTAGQLFVDYTYSENGTGGCDVPVFSMKFETDAAVQELCYGESALTCSFNNVYGATEWVNFDYTHSIPKLIEKLDETGFIELPIPRGIIRLFRDSEDHVFLYLYATAYELDPTQSSFRKTSYFNNLNTEENSSFAALLIDNMNQVLPYVMSLPGQNSYSSFKNKVFIKENPALIATNWNGILYDVTKFDVNNHNGSADFVESLLFKNVLYDGDHTTDASQIARSLIMHLLFGIVWRNADEESFSFLMSVKTNSTYPEYNLTSITSGGNVWQYGFYPYYTYDSANFDIHAQTDSEKIKEVKIALITIIVAVAATVITVKAIKLRKKILSKAMERDVAAWEAWDDAATESDPIVKQNKMNLAWKTQRKANRWNKIATIFGFTNQSSIADTYSQSYYSNKTDMSIEQIRSLIR